MCLKLTCNRQVAYRRTGESSNQLVKRKVPSSETSYVIEGLKADSSYIVVVTAVAEGGHRMSSQIVTCKTFGAGRLFSCKLV